MPIQISCATDVELQRMLHAGYTDHYTSLIQAEITNRWAYANSRST